MCTDTLLQSLSHDQCRGVRSGSCPHCKWLVWKRSEWKGREPLERVTCQSLALSLSNWSAGHPEGRKAPKPQPSDCHPSPDAGSYIEPLQSLVIALLESADLMSNCMMDCALNAMFKCHVVKLEIIRLPQIAVPLSLLESGKMRRSAW